MKNQEGEVNTVKYATARIVVLNETLKEEVEVLDFLPNFTLTTFNYTQNVN